MLASQFGIHPALGSFCGAADEIRGRGACHLPDGAIRMVTSALDVFADDLLAHRRGRCIAKGQVS